MPPKRKRGAAAKKAKVDAASEADEVQQTETVAVVTGNSPAATLVVELLDRIFEFVVGKYWGPIFSWLNKEYWKATAKRKIGLPLVHVARVNKYWHSVAMRRLYRTVVISNPVTMRLLARTLREGPSCAFTDYIQSFTIEYWYNDLPSHPDKRKEEVQARKENSEATWEVLPYIKKLHHFGMSNSSLEPMPRGPEHPPIPEFMTGLKSISLREECWSHFLYSKWIFAAAPTLERFRAPTYAAGGVYTTCPPMVHLRSLCAHGHNGWRLGYVGPAFNRAAGAYGRLEDVSVSGTLLDPDLRSVSAMLHCIAPTIRRLHLNISFAHHSELQGLLYDTLAGALPAAANLRVFSLAILRSPLLDDRAALVAAIPASVQTLVLRQGLPPGWEPASSPNGRDALSIYADETEAVLARVERGELVKLKTFRMAGYPYFADQTHDYYAKERKVFARRQTQLAQSAKKLGVDLSFVREAPDQLAWYC